MKKILMISGSPRKKNTWHLLTQLEEILLESGYQTELIRITDYQIKECRGCEHCVKGGICPIKDDMPLLLQKMVDADALILASPVYMCQISSHLKRMIDRTPHWFHRPVLTGKPSFSIITTAGSYQKESSNYLKTLLYHWGTNYCGWLYRKAGTLDIQIEKNEIASFLKQLESSTSYRPSLKNLMLFQVQKVLAQKIIPADQTYWEKKGWIKADYFSPAKIPLWKKILSRSFYKMLFNKMKPVPHRVLE